MKRRFVAAALLAIGTMGCTAFAGKADYADYRAVRMASDERQRLLAMQRYASRHPDGRFLREVQAERAAREPEVFEAGKSDRAGLELYLRAYPEGRFAGLARSMLEAMKQVDDRRRRDRERAKELSLQRQREQELLRRTWVARFASWWIRALLSIEGWGTALPEIARANPAFSRAFGRPPVPRCSRDECVKGFRSRFAVPVPGGTRVEREMRVLLRLRMERGDLRRAELLMPQRGFSRWYELENQKLIVDEDSEDRERAVSWAFGALQRLLMEGESEIEPVPGVALAPIAAPAINPVPELSERDGNTSGIPIPSEATLDASAESDVPSEATPAVAANPFDPEPGSAPDLVMDTLQVPADAAPPVVPGPAADIVMDTLTVTEDEGGAPVTESASDDEEQVRSSASVDSGEPYRVRGFRLAELRIVVFAARAGRSSPAYDGIAIEFDRLDSARR